MSDQQLCRQFGRAPEHAAVLEREVGLDVLHSDPAVPAFGDLACREPSRIEAGMPLEETAPALACIPSAPPEFSADSASINPDTRNSAPNITQCYIATPRGWFSALVAEPSTPPSRGTVLCLHGFMSTKDSFLPLIWPLVAAGYRVCAFDQRGHSETVPLQKRETDDDVRLSTLGLDVIAIIHALGGEPVHLVGCSMGGLVAQEAALIDSGSIATLTMLASGPGAVGSNKARELCWLSMALRLLPRDCVYRAMRAYQARRSPAWRRPVMDARRERVLHQQFQLHSRRALLRLATELRTAKDRSGEVGGLGLRSLVVCGDRDRVWTVNRQRAMADRLNAQLMVLSGFGHCLLISATDLTASALLNFFPYADADGQSPQPATAAVPELMWQRRPTGIANPEGSHEASSAA